VSREQSYLPAAQVEVERIRETKNIIDGLQSVVTNINRDISNLRMQILQKEIERNQQQQLIRQARHQLMNRGESEPQERKKFVKQCPGEDCRGFLSTRWKCGTCEINVCKDCHVILNSEEHKCEEDAIKSVIEINKSAKGCPTCGIPIFKSSGCFSGDTQIPMWNGSSKNAKDIIIGDILIGDDGNPRNVLHLMNGIDKMFQIKQTNGTMYVVNSQHTLALKLSGDRTISWYNTIDSWKIRWFDHFFKQVKTKNFKVSDYSSKDMAYDAICLFKQSLDFPEVIEITVSDYMNLPVSTKKNLVGFKSTSCVNWEEQPIELDPYILGVWLGDGINTGLAFAGTDIEILQHIVEWCSQNSSELVHDAPYKFRVRKMSGKFKRKAITHGATCTECYGCSMKKSNICDLATDMSTFVESSSSDTHYLKSTLSSLNLIKNKHIPDIYLRNTRDVRLQLLAGIIDTDGCLQNEGKRIVITQTNYKLSEQVIYLARSLGFIVFYTIRARDSESIFGLPPKDYKPTYSINISGPSIHEIPTKVVRKKCISTSSNKDYSRTSIQVLPIGQGEYFGWSVDDNKRFILDDFTVVRNCSQMFCTECHTAFDWRTGRIEKGVIHNPHYYEYRRANGINTRNIGEIRCGGLPDYNRHHTQRTKEYHRTIAHYTMELRGQNLLRDNVNDNMDLRVKYLMNDITDDKFKILLQRREKKKDVDRHYHEIVDTFNLTGVEMFQLLDKKEITEQKLHEQLRKVMQFSNNAIKDINSLYKVKRQTLVIQY